MPIEDIVSHYYLRFDVEDQPGVLAFVAGALGEQGVSIEQMVQEGRAEYDGGAVPVLMITHASKEGAVRRAMSRIATAPFMKAPPRLLRIEAV
jgi:homoserine dehydrogenase